MSVYYDQRDGIWRVQLQKDHRRISTTARSAEEARALEGKLRKDLFLARLGERPSRTLEDALLRWLKHEVPNLRSRKATESHARALVGYVEGKPLDQVAEVWELYRSDHPDLSNSTRNRRGAILRRVANLAFRWGWTDAQLGKKIQLLPENPARQLYLTPAQVRHLVKACSYQPARDAMLIAAYAGLRLGEIMRLQPADIRAGTITVRPGKTARARPVPAHPTLAGPLRRLPIPCGWRWILRHFERARAAIGMPQIRFHDLRHTNATWLLENGADITEVRDLLGHSHTGVTSRYLHTAGANLKRAVRRLK